MDVVLNVFKDQTLFLKDRLEFPQGSPPGRGSSGFTSTDVMLCFSHTNDNRCRQLCPCSASKHMTVNVFVSKRDLHASMPL